MGAAMNEWRCDPIEKREKGEREKRREEERKRRKKEKKKRAARDYRGASDEKTNKKEEGGVRVMNEGWDMGWEGMGWELGRERLERGGEKGEKTRRENRTRGKERKNKRTVSVGLSICLSAEEDGDLSSLSLPPMLHGSFERMSVHSHRGGQTGVGPDLSSARSLFSFFSFLSAGCALRCVSRMHTIPGVPRCRCRCLCPALSTGSNVVSLCSLCVL